MLLLERDGNICKCGCGYIFTSMDEMRVDHIDGSESHNCLSNMQLLRHSHNIKKGYTEPDHTHWLASSYPESSRQKARVCVPSSVFESLLEYDEEIIGDSMGDRVQIRKVRPHSSSIYTLSLEELRKRRPQPKAALHSIIPRDRQEIDDHEETDTSSQSKNKKNEPKYCLYFMLQVKLGHKFRATDAKAGFSLFLNIPHGTIRNHYYSRMSKYFERDEQGIFLDQRKPSVKPFLEESEIERMLTGRIDDDLLALYSEALQMTKDDLLQMLRNAPVLQEL